MIVTYVPSVVNDILLVRWYTRMSEEGDLDRVFHPSAKPLSEFFANMRKTFLMLLVSEKDGIYGAFWGEPMLSGAFIGAWIAKDHRSNFATLHETAKALKTIARQFEGPLLAVTGNEDLLELHQRLGYTVLGEIPKLWAGRSAWLLSAQREDFVFVEQGRQQRGGSPSADQQAAAGGISTPAGGATGPVS